MKIKVGNTIYSGEDEPIMVILTDKDKENIRNMSDTSTKYCMFPDTYSSELIELWMKSGVKDD